MGSGSKIKHENYKVAPGTTIVPDSDVTEDPEELLTIAGFEGSDVPVDANEAGDDLWETAFLGEENVDLGEWQATGIYAHEAAEWYSMGISPAVATEWDQSGFDPETATKYVEQGMNPVQAMV